MSRHAAALAVLLGGNLASAETPVDRPTAIEVDREATPLTRPELGFDGGAPLPGGWAVAIGGGWLEKPIIFSSAGGDANPVRRRETLVLAGSLALGESAVLDLRMPLAHQIGSRLRLAGDPTPDERRLDKWVIGDLGIGARIRVVGRPVWSVFVRGDLTLPTGDAGDFAGEHSWTLAWSMIGRVQLPAHVILAATGGLRLRGDEVEVADRIVSNELTGGIGVAVGLPPIRPLWCVHEQMQLTAEVVGVLADKVANVKGPSPREVRVGLVTRPRENVTFSLRVGTGLASDEIGAPAFRALAVLTFAGAGNVASLFPSIETESEDDAVESDDEDLASIDAAGP
jgi:hypothetical protein